MIYYLTYNEPYSGIYNSQVIDVVKHIRINHKTSIRLIAFIPIGYRLSQFFSIKSKIKSKEITSIIIPTFPIQYGWRFNWILLCIVLFFKKRGAIISREIFATSIALRCKKIGLVTKICHDGRGASLAQLNEYNIYSANTKQDILAIEPVAVNSADYRMSVSNSLISYWKNKFKYNSENHVVIPCTISAEYICEINKLNYEKIRNDYNINQDDIVMVFSGSSYEWQSLRLIVEFSKLHLQEYKNLKIYFLTHQNEVIKELQDQFNGRVFCTWLSMDKVIEFLMACDYGILLRESNDTNNVASPTKFGEYLAAGLQIIISDNLEFSNIVLENKCGNVVNNNNLLLLPIQRTTIDVKISNQQIATKYLYKTSEINMKSYNAIINNIL